jgi:hypothetical protein
MKVTVSIVPCDVDVYKADAKVQMELTELQCYSLVKRKM